MYGEVVQNLIAACEWDTTNFLVVSDNVFDPFIYYSHILPLIVSLTIGLFVFYKNPKLLLSRILFAATTLFSAWVFFDLILWATDRPDYTIFFWSLLVCIEPLIYAACLYFVQVFITGRDSPLESKLVISLFLIPTFLLAHTRYALLGYDLVNCDREAIEGPLTHYTYIVEIFYTVWIALFAIESYIKIKDKIKRKQIVLITLGILLFLLTFSSGNIIGSLTDDWRLPQWGLFGMPIFTAFIAYLIVKYHTFSIGLIATQALAVTLSVLIGSQFFFIRSAGNQVLNGITFLISIAGGILLVRSVEKEILQREKLQVLTGDLRVANDRLKQLDKAKTEFVSMGSHQLRAPVTAIKGYSSMLLEGSFGKISEKARGAVDVIFQSSQKLVGVIEDFLNVTRIELGTMKYDMTTFDFKKLVEQAIKELGPNAEKKGLALSFEPAAGQTFEVKADYGKISQVVNNLIDNAIKYTFSGSVKVTLDHVGEKTQLKISDTGVGITSETMPKLFQKFARAEDANKANVTGTGLGLYVAKQIIEAHKGKIWAESPGHNQGSTFTVEL